MSLTAQTVTNYYTGILRQTPTAAEVQSLISLYSTTIQLTDFLLGQANTEVDPVVRLYQAAFDRVPDTGGLTYWVNQYTVNGGTMSLAQMATAWTSQPEFVSDYGGFLNATPPNYRAYVSALYVNVLGRQGETAGINYWTNELTTGARTAANVLLEFSQSPEFTNTVGDAVNNFLTECGQYANGDITTSPYTGTIWDFGSFGATYTLTTNIDTFTGTTFNDTFNASLGGASVNVNTLNTLDSLNGAGGIDTLNAQIHTSVTPTALTNIELINVTADAAVTLGLANAGQLTNVTNNTSTGVLTVSGIVETASVAVNTVGDVSGGAGSDAIFNFVSTAASDANLTVSNVTAAAEIEINNTSGTVNVTSSGSTANSITLTENSDTIDTVNVDGANAITLVAADATVVDASELTGALTFSLGVAGSVAGGSANDLLTSNYASSISGNAGQDTIDVDGAAVVVSVNGGADNDTLLFGTRLVANTSTAANNDTVDGGTGVDVLSATSNTFAAVDNTAAGAIQSISNIEQLTVSNALTDDITLSKIQAGIEQVNLTLGTNAAGAAYTLTFDSGVDATVALSAAIGTGDTLGVTAAGTGTTDSVTVSNAMTTGTTDVFGAEVLTVTGYETITLDGGSVATATQSLTTTNVNGSDGEAATLYVTGANAFTLGNYTTDNTGLQTIDATGLTMTTGTVFSYTDGTFGTGATASITGSAGNDSIVANNGKAATIDGGAGIDTLTGGSAADSILGGLGNDVIDGGTGNDVLKGNEGDDSITAGTGSVSIDGGADNDTIVLGSTLDATDTVDGGAGVNTLSITAAVTSPSVGARVSNVQALTTSATAQDISMFTATTLTTVNQSAAGNGTLAITNAGATLNTLNILEGNALTTGFARAVDTSSNALTVTAGIAIAAASTLTASNEESLTLAGSTFAVDLDLLTMTDLTSLVVTGSGNQVIDAQAATLLATVDVSGVTGTATVNVDASDSTVGLTFTGAASTGNQTITSGSGADVITAGSGITVVIAGAGNDTVTGSTLADTITGGAGADSVTGGTGADTFLVGTTLTDWAVGDYVAGGTGTDILSFGAAGIITYVDRTVSDVETLTLTAGAGNRVTVVEGTGLTTVNNLDTALNTLTLNHATNVFAAEAATASDVNSASEWFYEVNLSGDGELTYYDEVIADAVTITLVGSDATATSDAAVVGGNIVVTLV